MFPDLIDICAPEHAFVIKDDIGTHQNIHEQFVKRAANVLSLYCTNKSKRNWEQLDQKSLKFHLHEDQLASYQEVEDEVASPRNDVQEWRATHANLEAEKKYLFDERRDTINSMGKEICHLQNTNNQLQEYVKCLEKDEGFAYNGKYISETKDKQRTFKAFLTRAETALQFSQAFGLHVESLRVKEADRENIRSKC